MVGSADVLFAVASVEDAVSEFAGNGGYSEAFDKVNLCHFCVRCKVYGVRCMVYGVYKHRTFIFQKSGAKIRQD